MHIFIDTEYTLPSALLLLNIVQLLVNIIVGDNFDDELSLNSQLISAEIKCGESRFHYLERVSFTRFLTTKSFTNALFRIQSILISRFIVNLFHAEDKTRRVSTASGPSHSESTGLDFRRLTTTEDILGPVGASLLTNTRASAWQDEDDWEVGNDSDISVAEDSDTLQSASNA